MNQGFRQVRVGHPILDLSAERLSERLHGRQEHPAVLAVHRAAHGRGIVHKVIDAIRLGLSVDIDAVHAEHLDEQLAFQRCTGDVVQIDTCGRVVVPHPDAEVLRAQAERLQRVDVLHHQVPQRSHIAILELDTCHGALEHLQDERIRGRVSVLAERAHLIGLPFEGVLVGHGQHLSVVQGLAQADESKAVVVGELGLGQTAGISDALVVNALAVDRLSVHTRVRCNGRTRAAEPDDIRVPRHVEEDVIVEVARGLVEVDAQSRVVREVRHGKVTRQIIRVFPDVGEGDHVSNVLRVGLSVDHVDFNPGDARAGIHHRQALHGVVVPVPEIGGQEVVPVGLVIVGPDVEFLRLGAALNFDFLALAFLLAEHRGVVHLAPLRLELGAEQRLAALDEGALKRHADVAGLDVLQNVVLLALEPDVHLVFEVESGLRVVVGAEVDLLADAAIDGQLDALVEVECGDRPVPLGKSGVFRLAVAHAEVEFR